MFGSRSVRWKGRSRRVAVVPASRSVISTVDGCRSAASVSVLRSQSSIRTKLARRRPVAGPTDRSARRRSVGPGPLAAVVMAIDEIAVTGLARVGDSITAHCWPVSPAIQVVCSVADAAAAAATTAPAATCGSAWRATVKWTTRNLHGPSRNVNDWSWLLILRLAWIVALRRAREKILLVKFRAV